MSIPIKDGSEKQKSKENQHIQSEENRLDEKNRHRFNSIDIEFEDKYNFKGINVLDFPSDSDDSDFKDDSDYSDEDEFFP